MYAIAEFHSSMSFVATAVVIFAHMGNLKMLDSRISCCFCLDFCVSLIVLATGIGEHSIPLLHN